MLQVFETHPRRRAVGHDGADRRRERHRQGAGGALDPPALAVAEGPFVAVHTGAIPQELIASRAVRPREGRVHRRRRQEAGQVRAGRGRHAVPRRDLDDGRAHADQPAARARDALRTRASAARRSATRQRARARGVEPRPRGDGQGGPVPRGPLLSAQHLRGEAAAAARALRGHPGASPASSCASSRQVRQAGGAHSGGDAAPAGQLQLAGQRARAAQRRSSRRCCWRAAPSSSRSSCRRCCIAGRCARTSSRSRSARRWTTSSARSSCARSRPTPATRRRPPRCSASAAAASTTSWRSTASRPATMTSATPPKARLRPVPASQLLRPTRLCACVAFVHAPTAHVQKQYSVPASAGAGRASASRAPRRRPRGTRARSIGLAKKGTPSSRGDLGAARIAGDQEDAELGLAQARRGDHVLAVDPGHRQVGDQQVGAVER